MGERERLITSLDKALVYERSGDYVIEFDNGWDTKIDREVDTKVILAIMVDRYTREGVHPVLAAKNILEAMIDAGQTCSAGQEKSP